MREKNRRQINFRLTKEEWDWLEYQIQTNNIPMSVSTYAKKQTLFGEIYCLGISSDDAKIITTSLAQIGNNLNQITKRLNSGEKMAMHLYGSVIDDVADLKKLILKLLEIKEQKKIKKISPEKKQLKKFYDWLDKNGIPHTIGRDVIFEIMVAISKATTQEQKNELIAEAITEKNITTDLAKKIWQIYCYTMVEES